MTPTDFAAQLGIPAGRLRGWLRRTWPPPTPGQRWYLTDEQVSAARAHFGSGEAAGQRRAIQPAGPRTGGRPDSDEAYVLGLLDEVLGEANRHWTSDDNQRTPRNANNQSRPHRREQRASGLDIQDLQRYAVGLRPILDPEPLISAHHNERRRSRKQH